MTKSPSEADRRIGARIRLRRLMLGMSQHRLAEGLGLTFQQVQKYEKGSNRIGAGRLQEIARLLEVPVGFFYEDEPQQEASPATTLLATPQGIRLFQAFEAIGSSELRRKTVEMVETVAAMKG